MNSKIALLYVGLFYLSQFYLLQYIESKKKAPTIAGESEVF